MQKEFGFPKMIGSIQFLRFFAAIAVAFSHFAIINEITDTAFNVTFFLRWFFSISGFIVMLSTQQPEKKRGFLCRRLIRLAPLYWLLTVFVFFVAQFMPKLIGYTPNFEQLVKSLFFIPFSRETLKSGITLRPIVGLGHTLQMEMFFSLVFAISMKISHKYRGLISGIAMLGLALIGMLVPFQNDFCNFYLNMNYWSLLSFAVGILCYYFLSWMKSIRAKNQTLLIFSGGVAVISLILTHLAYAVLRSSKLVCIIGFVSFIAIIAFATAYSASGFKVPRLLHKLGDASFSFYLIHYFIISVAERFLHIDSFSPRNIILMLFAIVVSWVVAYVSYLLIEKHFGGWLVKKLNAFLNRKNV